MDIKEKYEITQQYIKVLQDEQNNNNNNNKEQELQQKIEQLTQEHKILQKHIQDKKEHIQQLKQEITEITENNKILTNTNKLNKERNTDLTDLYNTEQAKNKQLEQDLRKVKETMKKPATLNNTLDLFEQIKNDKAISFLKPTQNNNMKKFIDSPIFEYDNKGAIFYKKRLIGMYEKTSDNIKYYQHEKTSINAPAESILFQVMKIHKPALDCKLKYGQGCGKSLKYMSYSQILSKEPCYNTRYNKFESNKNYQYIYMERDGSKYIIHHGKKEYL